MVSLREAARRVVLEKIAPSMSHQRVSQLARTDPEFPPTEMIGRSMAADWRQLRPYFEAHAMKAAARDSRRKQKSKGVSEEG